MASIIWAVLLEGIIYLYLITGEVVMYQAINLRKGVNTIDGFDYHTASYFNVTVNGSNVTIFDYQVAKYYMYSVS